MDSATAARLTQINRQFYERVAPEFSLSRRALNPGITRGLEGAGTCHSLLDVGCGDGRIGLAWARGELPLPWTEGARYVGLDQSAALLAARAPWPPGLHAVQADLLTDPWPQGPFDVVCCLAVLHHLPGRPARLRALRRISRRLAPGGLWLLSVWQFLHVEGLRRRVRDWSEVDIDPRAPDAGDLLVDWRRGPQALRYVHHYDEDELAADCVAAGLGRGQSFRSDGRSGDLGLYLRGRRPDR